MSQPSPTAAQVAAALPQAWDILNDWYEYTYYTKPMHKPAYEPLAQRIACALAEREAAVRAETWEAAAVLAQHHSVYGDGRGKPESHDKGWADACLAIAAALREAARG